MRRISLALALAGAVAATGCGQTSQPASPGGNRVLTGSSFKLTVRGEKRYTASNGTVYMLPEGGLVTGNGISCGYNTSGVAQTACEAQVVYGSPVALQIANFYGNNGALPPVSYGFYGFAGACTGSGTATGTTACSIAAMDADRLVLVRFAFTQDGLSSHGPYQDSAVHGAAFETKALTCATAACHGTALQGAGLAPACATCHNGSLAYTITFPAIPSAVITKGGHFDATAMAWTAYPNRKGCQRCHTSGGFKDWAGVDGSANFLADPYVGAISTTTQATGPLKCDACHNSISEPTTDAIGITTIVFPSQIRVVTDKMTALCGQCHQGRESTTSLNALIGSTAADAFIDAAGTAFVNPHYLGAAGTLYGSQGQMWGQYSGKTYEGKFLHGGLNSCTYCHDAHDGEIQIAKCGQCHTTASGAKVSTVAELEASRQVGWTGDIDGDGNTTEGIMAEVDGLKATLYTALKAYAKDVKGIALVYADASHPYFFVDVNGNGVRDGYAADGTKLSTWDPTTADSTAYTMWTPRSMRAAFNLKWAYADRGAWAHNTRYAVQVLHDAIDDLNAGLTAAGKATVTFNGVRDGFAPAAITALGGHFDAAAAPWGDHGGRAWDAPCLRCHTSQGYQDYMGLDGSPNFKAGTFATTNTLKSTTVACEAAGTCTTGAYHYGPLQCQTCHNAASDPFDAVGITTVFWMQAGYYATPAAASTKYSTTDKVTGVCAQCHQGRESAASINQQIANKGAATADSKFSGSFMNPHYMGAAATIFGGEAEGWVEVATSVASAPGTYYGSVYTGKNPHGGAAKCTFCHDPHTGALPPDGAGAAQIGGKCGGCHFDDAGAPITSFLVLEETRQYGFEGDVDGDGNAAESVKQEIDGVAAQLYAVMQAYAAALNAGGTITYGDAYPYFAVSPSTGWSPRLMRAAVNYKWYKAEAGAWAHNPRFVVEVLFDSIMDLKAGIAALGGTRPLTTAKRAFDGHFGAGEAGYSALLYHWYEPFNAKGASMGFTSAACYQCHGGDGGLTTYLAGSGAALADSVMVNKVTAFQCSTCHVLTGTDMTSIRSDVTTLYFPGQKPDVVAPATPKYVAIAATAFSAPADRVCATCHAGRENKVSVDDAIAAVTPDPANAWTYAFVNPHYLGAAGVMFGADAHMLYEYAGKTYAAKSVRSCVGCHNPKATKHGFEVTPAAGDLNKTAIANLTAELYSAITAYSQSPTAAAAGGSPVCYSTTYPYWFVDANGDGTCDTGEKTPAKMDARVLKAAFNHKWSMAEPGAYTHNYAYMAEILWDSIVDLGYTPTSLTARP